ncbi:MAG: DUF4007 family protein [Bacilli bacterium]
MNKTLNLKFKKNESFYLRDGWLEKAINAIYENKLNNIFSKNNGISILGIGSNMVKSLKYWLQASNVIISTNNKTELSLFGELLYKYDRYLENQFSLFLIHYNLVKNMIECPLFYGLFNIDIKTFTKNDFVSVISSYFQSLDLEVKKEYLEDDTGVLLKSYINDSKGDNPEDNYVCPLAYLRLLEKKGDKYIKTKPIYQSLSYLIVYLCLVDLYEGQSFNIEDSIDEINSPIKIFNLDKNMYLQYLEEMKKNQLITINKTAGLNTVYFEEKLTLEEVFIRYYEEE